MRYFIGFLVTVGLVIILIILLFNGGDKSKVSHTTKTLIDYATTDSQVSMTIAGPINAVSQHQELQVTVNRDNVTYQQMTGYDGEVVNTQIFANTESAYDAFLHALQHAGFTRGNNAPALRDDVGFCSTGQRYIFELTENGKDLQRYWATNCGGTKTYLGSRDLTLTLFRAQVPGYTELTSNLQVN
jgi:hypothetical protein